MSAQTIISDERAEAIAQLAGITPNQVRAVACADWTEGPEHQQWLDTAPVMEIADWVMTVRASNE